MTKQQPRWQSGTYSVVLSVGDFLKNYPYRRNDLAQVLTNHCGLSNPVALETLKRAEHVAPETIAYGVSLDDAIRLKQAFEPHARLHGLG
ncbi:MAG TPA: hypothetical protein VFG75_11155, partial [Gaiella sp.]|nr:hypothetical protein [Gaiella sp.]